MIFKPRRMILGLTVVDTGFRNVVAVPVSTFKLGMPNVG
jgi:hypothetical protein